MMSNPLLAAYTLCPETESPKMTVRLPKEYLALSLLGPNRVRNGDTFQPNGYVKGSDGSMRKWFTPRSGWNHYWEPAAELHRVEKLYYKLCIREQWRVRRHIALTREIYRKGGVAHAQTPGGWRKLTVSYSSALDTLIIDTAYLPRDPKEPILLDLGNKLSQARCMPLWRNKLHELLVHKLMAYVEGIKLPNGIRYISLQINGRTYFLTCQREESCVRIIQLVGGAEMTCIEL